jgi:hypothetical protein
MLAMACSIRARPTTVPKTFDADDGLFHPGAPDDVGAVDTDRRRLEAARDHRLLDPASDLVPVPHAASSPRSWSKETSTTPPASSRSMASNAVYARVQPSGASRTSSSQRRMGVEVAVMGPVR